jgi:uncharacterized damage-inducible protein DinB
MTNKEFFVQTWRNEMNTTLNAIKALPSDTSKWSYKCTEKSRTASALIAHMLEHAKVMSNTTRTLIADERTQPPQFDSVEDAAAYFEKWATGTADDINAMDEATWDEKMIDFQVDGTSFYKMTMGRLGWMLLFDIVHHRGQLSTYYRHMGVRNPNIYGPTAEDIEAMMTAKN